MPDRHTVLVLAREVLQRLLEPELPENMLQNSAGHYNTDIVPFREPLPYGVLGIPHVLLPRDDIVEAEPVLLPQFQPA